MYISAVLSFLGAWQKLREEHPTILQEIEQVLTATHSTDIINAGSSRHSSLVDPFSVLGWESDVTLPYGKNKSRRRSIDFIKNGIGLEDSFSSRTLSLQADLLIKYPPFIQTRHFQVLVILVPMLSLREIVSANNSNRYMLSNFEELADELTELYPLPLKYPFAILGITEAPPVGKVIERELTSNMDQFLIESIGLTFDEMHLLTEQPQFDFKQELPDTKDFAELAASLANLSGGGVVLIGVDDQGAITGLPRGKELDELLLRVSNTIQDSCQPRPRFDLRVFDDPSDPDQCVVVVRIHELEYKPCMVRGRVYIRAGSSTQAAGPDEIRRLILG